MRRLDPIRLEALHDAAATRAIEQALAATLPPHTLMAHAGESVARLAKALHPHPQVRGGALSEREEVEEGPDGSVIVRHQVADPRWIVRHVLSYGPEAEILEPAEMRDLARETVAAELHAGG